MKFMREQRDDGGGGECSSGDVVVVGVKFDARGRELLTWTLMKVAEPGHRVIAIHALDSASEPVIGTASLLSLVNTFDSLLAVYEGFCNLKQVDLKLKVCRGSSVEKILVREAKVSGASKVVLGTSKTCRGIGSSTSVAKHCARKLGKGVSVIAFSNGKIVYQREATQTKFVSQENSNKQIRICSQKSQDSVERAERVARDRSFRTKVVEQFHGNNKEDNSLVLVPYQGNVVEPTMGWSFLRGIFLPNKAQKEKFQAIKASVVRWIQRSPAQNSFCVVYPDKKQCISHVNEDCCPNLRNNGAVVLVGPEVAWAPVSPFHVSNDLPEELKFLLRKYTSLCRLFSSEELMLATSNFAPENIVGKGGSSYVYKGYLPDGKEIAVKILKPSKDMLREFTSEIEIITTLHHKNIISLIGFCFEHNKLSLVYDFLGRGSLEENLHGSKKDCSSFGWHERYRVALGVAEALDYLHNVSDQPVIHKDVKSSNILLSDNFEPQLSDFGLAGWVSSVSQVTCTDVAGTFGYLAPEYFMHGKVSDKVDVFAFGVVLLELLSGRMPIEKENIKGNQSIMIWAKPMLKDGKFSKLLDPQITSEYNNDQIELMALAANLCIRRSPKSRPQMSLILKLLQGDEEMAGWARQQLDNASEEVDAIDGDELPSNIQSHLNLALQDVDDDSFSSTEQGVSLEDYLQGRGSRTSSCLSNHACSE